MKNIDYLGAFPVIVGILLIILELTEGGESWRSAKAIAPLIVGILLCLVALLFEGVYIKRFKLMNNNKDLESHRRLRLDLLFPPEVLSIPNFLYFPICLWYILCNVSHDNCS